MIKNVIRFIFGSIEDDVNEVIELEKSIQLNKEKALELSEEFLPIIRKLENNSKFMNILCKSKNNDDDKYDYLITLRNIDDKLEKAKSEYYISIGELRKSNQEFDERIEKLLKKDNVEKFVSLYKKSEKLEKSINIIQNKYDDELLDESVYIDACFNYFVKSLEIKLEKSQNKSQQDKIAKVMREFKAGTLRSSSGDKVISKKQAIAIALSEAGLSKSDMNDPCWDGYEMIGMKVKDGKGVPNCVKKAELDLMYKVADNDWDNYEVEKAEEKDFPINGTIKQSTRQGKKAMVFMDGKYYHFGDSKMKHNYSDSARRSATARHKKNLQGSDSRAKAFRVYWKKYWGKGGSVKNTDTRVEKSESSEPTEAQKYAGNYKKEKRKIRGLIVSIENQKGSIRSGKSEDGKEWSVKMNNDYGYFNRTQGKDGDHIDVFLSNNPEKGNIYIIDQLNNKGNFDEHKVMMGFKSSEDALKNYKSNYEKGFDVKYSGITEVSDERLKKWLGVDNGGREKKRKPFSELRKSEDFEVNIFDEFEKSLINIKEAINDGRLPKDILEKARIGKYVDNVQNRRLNRVGQPYGQKVKEDETKGEKQAKTDNKKGSDGSLEEQAKQASGSALEAAAKEANDPEVRIAAHKELVRREKEEKVQDEDNKTDVGEEKKKDMPIEKDDFGKESESTVTEKDDKPKENDDIWEDEDVEKETANKRDDKLQKELLKHYFGSELGVRGAGYASAMKYDNLGVIELRIADHSANPNRQGAYPVSIVTHEFDPTEDKFISAVGMNVSGMPKEDAISKINNKIKQQFDKYVSDIGRIDDTLELNEFLETVDKVDNVIDLGDKVIDRLIKDKTKGLILKEIMYSIEDINNNYNHLYSGDLDIEVREEEKEDIKKDTPLKDVDIKIGDILHHKNLSIKDTFKVEKVLGDKIEYIDKLGYRKKILLSMLKKDDSVKKSLQEKSVEELEEIVKSESGELRYLAVEELDRRLEESRNKL